MYKKYEELLKQRGITSYRVAKETGISESVLSMWKQRSESDKDHVGISLANLAKVAKFFGVTVDYFLSK